MWESSAYTGTSVTIGAKPSMISVRCCALLLVLCQQPGPALHIPSTLSMVESLSDVFRSACRRVLGLGRR